MDTFTVIVGMVLQGLMPASAIGATIIVLLRTRTGRGLMQRLMGPNIEASDVATLKDEVTRLQEEVIEIQERLDFTERALLRSDAAPKPLREPTPEQMTHV